ncbi:MAG: DUF1570 domain-containing protein [Planctomycetota bacterium]|jgi:hypothetical protein
MLSTIRIPRTLLIGALLVLLPTLALAQSKAEKKAARARKAAIVGKYPPRPWSKAIVHESKFYKVTTNTDEKTAKYIGSLMDFAQKNFRETFTFSGDVPLIPVFAYRTYEEYLREGNAPAGSAGFFRYRGAETEIQVAYVRDFGSTGPTKTLLHEGVHQFVHLALSMPIPEAYKDKFPPEMTRLQTLPRWLNEGLATYMERGYYDGKRLVIGEINKDRLRHLQSMIRSNQNCPLKDLFNIHDIQDFQLPHYAMSWGVTYWFLQDRSKSKAKKKRKILKAYVEAAKKGFMEDPEKELKTRFFDNPELRTKGFWQLWREHIQTEGYKTFVKLTVKKEADFPKWEKAWVKWISKLRSSYPYGGLKKK